MGTQTTMPCAQAADSGLLGPLQSPNWVKVCLVSTVFFLPVSTEPGVEKCLGLSVGDRALCLIEGSILRIAAHQYGRTVEGIFNIGCDPTLRNSFG